MTVLITDTNMSTFFSLARSKYFLLMFYFVKAALITYILTFRLKNKPVINLEIVGLLRSDSNACFYPEIDGN